MQLNYRDFSPSLPPPNLHLSFCVLSICLSLVGKDFQVGMMHRVIRSVASPMSSNRSMCHTIIFQNKKIAVGTEEH